MSTIDNLRALPEAADAELIEVAGNRIRIITAKASQLVCDYTAAPLFPGPPLHVHPGFDETFVMLEGRLEVTVLDEHAELKFQKRRPMSAATFRIRSATPPASRRAFY